MKSKRPYLFDAIYRWLLDSNLTPHLLVDAGKVGVEVPHHLVQDGQIVLNILPAAIANYSIDEYGLGFSARFSGQSQDIYVPFQAMLALFSREDGNGLVFPSEDFDEIDNHQGKVLKGEKISAKPSSVEILKKEKSKKNRPTLKIIK